MEKEDKIIKALLNDEFIEKAPEGFTERIMNAIEVAELEKEENTIRTDWPYLLAIVGSIILALGIIFIIDSSIITHYYQTFTGYISGFFNQIISIFGNSQLKITTIYSSRGLVIGTFVIILALLFFDSIVLRKRRSLNLFMWSF